MISLRKRFTAYVVFQGAEHRRWWRMFTRRGWRHVYVIIPVYFPEPGLNALRYAQVINFWTDQVRADVIFKDPREVCRAALKEGATCVISLPIDQKFTGRYVARGLLTCVSMIKALLSIDAWYIWTPEQLARYMLRHGGQLMETPNNDSTIRGRSAPGGQEGASGAAEGSAPAGSVNQQTGG